MNNQLPTAQNLYDEFVDNVYNAYEHLETFKPVYLERIPKPKLQGDSQEEIKAYAGVMLQYEKDKKAYDKAKTIYNDFQHNKRNVFKEYCLIASNIRKIITDENRIKKFWDKACKDADGEHSSHKFYELQELLDLLI